MQRVLIVTVGGSHEPIVQAVRDHRPDMTFFLCSGDAPGRKGSHLEVNGPGMVNRSRGATTPDLPSIVVQLGEALQQWEIILIDDLDSLDVCYRTAVSVLARGRERFPAAPLIAAYAGGTKSMSAGLAMAAADDGDCELALVSGIRRDTLKVASGTQSTRPVGVWDIRLRKSLGLVRERLHSFDYGGAAKVLGSAAKNFPASAEHRLPIDEALTLCRAFEAWDCFHHVAARDLLSAVRPRLFTSGLGEYWSAVEVLCEDLEVLRKNEQGKLHSPYLVAADVLFNAERRARQGRFDDAIGRIYRAAEAIAQIRLLTRYGIDTGNVDPQLIPESFRAEFIDNRQIPLSKAWALLGALNDPVGQKFAAQQSGFANFSRWRNFSISAHGFQRVGEAEYQRYGMPMIAFCRDLIAHIPKQKGERWVAMKQLPEELPGLDLPVLSEVSKNVSQPARAR